jgi:hypothetical protein
MPNATRSADRAHSALGPGPSACKAKRPVSGRGQGRQPPKAVARSASLEAGRSQVYVKHSCSPVTGLVCHRHRRFRQLDTSVGASGPHDFAVRSKHVVSAPLRPSHPAPTSVTFAKRPSEWDRMIRFSAVSTKRKSEKFFARGLDTNFADLPVGQITQGRSGCRAGWPTRRADTRPMRNSA